MQPQGIALRIALSASVRPSVCLSSKLVTPEQKAAESSYLGCMRRGNCNR